jgi:TatD DNase family protein
MTNLTDTHCHIHTAEFKLLSDEATKNMWSKMAGPNPDAMIARAVQNGVSRMVCVGTTLGDSQQAVQFVQSRNNCWASIGLHPHEAKDGQKALNGIAALAGKPKVVAVGEIGLDYFYNHSNKQEQQKALCFQIELALQHNLPIIFHVRQAFDDFWPIFDSYKGIRGVLHSYTDSHANFTEAIKRGLYIGMNGIMTFTKVDEQLQVAKEVPLQKLLLETDAPFLTPKPLRGTVNEPAHVRLVAEFLAGLKQESPENLAASTTANALKLFSLN